MYVVLCKTALQYKTAQDRSCIAASSDPGLICICPRDTECYAVLQLLAILGLTVMSALQQPSLRPDLVITAPCSCCPALSSPALSGRALSGPALSGRALSGRGYRTG